MKAAGILAILLGLLLGGIAFNGASEDARSAASRIDDGYAMMRDGDSAGLAEANHEAESRTNAQHLEALGCAVCIIAGIALIGASRRSRAEAVSEQPAVRITIAPAKHEPRPWETPSHERREDAVREECGPCDKFFHSKVAGVTYKNGDGSSRLAVIRRCRLGEELSLLLGTMPEFPDSVAVCRDDGSQLGFLDSRLAGEVKRDMARGGQWRCFLMRKTEYEDKLTGADLCMARLSE